MTIMGVLSHGSIMSAWHWNADPCACRERYPGKVSGASDRITLNTRYLVSTIQL